MVIFDSIAPILLLLALGAALAKWKFLGREFMADLNRLAFWIALPAMIFFGVAHAGNPGRETLLLLGVMVVGTLLVFAFAWLTGIFLGLSGAGQGAMIQAGYRGNLVYIGIPVLAYAFDALPDAAQSVAMATALLVMAPMTALYNVLAVIALQVPQHKLTSGALRPVLRSILTNPLIIACAAGLAVNLSRIGVPRFIDRTFEALGGAAVPIALLCIGGALASIRLHGRKRGIVISTAIKVIVAPVIAFGLCRLVNLGGAELKIALVLAACPTAAAAYVMAKQLGGDEDLTSGAIALSTICSVPSLALALWLR